MGLISLGKIGRLLVAACLCGGTWQVCAASPLNIYVGQGQMPFVGGEEDRSGIFGDLMQALCVRLRLDCRFRSVPWRRVQLDAAQDPHGIILNLGRIPERNRDFVWLLDVLPTSYVIASRKRRFDDLPSALRAGSMTVMGGTPRSQEVQGLAQNSALVVEVNDPEQAARLLSSDRVLSWYEIDLRIHYLWKKFGLDPHELQFGKPLRSPQSYIAGSAALEDAEELHRRMTEAFQSMKADGSWRDILLRYLDEEKVRELLASTATVAQAR